MSWQADQWFNQFDGCVVHPRCLECPLPACRFDDPYWYFAWKASKKTKSAEKHTYGEWAEILGVDVRSVYRMVSNGNLSKDNILPVPIRSNLNCRHGHLRATNSYLRPNGQIRCRVCDRTYGKLKKEKRAELAKEVASNG